jgi:hypothetical protein
MLRAGLKQLMREIVNAFLVFHPPNTVELYNHSTETDQAPVKGQVWHALVVSTPPGRFWSLNGINFLISITQVRISRVQKQLARQALGDQMEKKLRSWYPCLFKSMFSTLLCQS